LAASFQLFEKSTIKPSFSISMKGKSAACTEIDRMLRPAGKAV
jgi:hypothetical protein